LIDEERSNVKINRLMIQHTLYKPLMALALLINIAEAYDGPPRRYFKIGEYPDSWGQIKNPALIGEEKGQTAAFGLYKSGPFDKTYPLLHFSAHVVKNIYLGYSYFSIYHAMEGQTPDYTSRSHSAAAAYKLDLSFRYLKYVIAGVSTCIRNRNFFNTVELMSISNDWGISALVFEEKKMKVKFGAVLQGMNNWDNTLHVSALDGMIYGTWAFNIIGDDHRYTTGKIPRLNGLLQTAVYGVRPAPLLDVSANFKNDDALWIGAGLIVPISSLISERLKDLLIQIDYSHDKILNANKGRGPAYAAVVKWGSDFFK
jgi:hypothetical protein